VRRLHVGTVNRQRGPRTPASAQAPRARTREFALWLDPGVSSVPNTPLTSGVTPRCSQIRRAPTLCLFVKTAVFVPAGAQFAQQFEHAGSSTNILRAEFARYSRCESFTAFFTSFPPVKPPHRRDDATPHRPRRPFAPPSALAGPAGVGRGQNRDEWFVNASTSVPSRSKRKSVKCIFAVERKTKIWFGGGGVTSEVRCMARQFRPSERPRRCRPMPTNSELWFPASEDHRAQAGLEKNRRDGKAVARLARPPASWNSGFVVALFLFEAQDWSRTNGIACENRGAAGKNPGVARAACQVRTKKGVPVDRSENFLVAVGRPRRTPGRKPARSCTSWASVCWARCGSSGARQKFRWRDCIEEMQQCGADGAPDR